MIKLNCKDWTWSELSDVVGAIHKEMKRRNPIGINAYAPVVKTASVYLRDIADAESVNPTSEHGPKEPRTRKRKQ